MGWLLLAFGLLLALLAVPVELLFQLERHPGWRSGLRLRWLFGLLDVPLKRPEHERRREVPVAKRPRARRKGGKANARRALRLLRSPELWHPAGRLLHQLWQALRPRDLWVRASVGLDDPADTGRLWGVLGPGVAILLPAGSDVRIQPDFEQARLELAASGRFRIIPLQLLGVALRFLFAPATWRLFWRLKAA